MFRGLFKRKVKVLTVKTRAKAKKSVKPKAKRAKTKKPKAAKRAVRPKKRRPAIKKGLRRLKPKPRVVGKVTHYFPHVKAGVILVSAGSIALGDTLQIKGHSTDFKQKVKSMQIDNAPIAKARPGQEIGLLVKSRVRHNDIVYKL